MPETDTTLVSASIASTGKGIRYIGNYAYAYSGQVTTSGTGSPNTSMLLFTTGAGIFVGTVAAQSDEAATAEEYLRVTFNGLSIINAKWDNASSGESTLDLPIPIIIPPFTEVEVLVGVSSGTDIWTAQIIGRVYGAE